jgi:lipoprotein-releasing system ATP-binding protein
MTNSNSTPVLEATGLWKEYHDGSRTLAVLRGADLSVVPGEIVSIVGTSGSGKSTLLHLLGALDRPSKGAVRIAGEDLSTRTARELAVIRNRHIGFIFQFHHLLAEFTALENVMAPGLIARRPEEEVRKIATGLLERLGLAERLTHRPSQLSGGEQQRVALARSILNGPSVIMADEPTGNLDAATAATVIELLWDEVRQQNRSLILVTHDPEIAARADRSLRLRDGLLVQG